MNTELKLVANARIPVARPFVTKTEVRWPWTLSVTERRADRAACRGETLNTDLLDLVLEARNLKTGVTRRKKNCGVER